MVPTPFASANASLCGISASHMLRIARVRRQLKAFYRGLWFGKYHVPMAPVRHHMLVFVIRFGFASNEEREYQGDAKKNSGKFDLLRESRFHFHP
jgi:hypothetical protein